MVKYSNFIVWTYLQYNLSYNPVRSGCLLSEILVQDNLPEVRKNAAVEAGMIFSCFVHCPDVCSVQKKAVRNLGGSE